MKTIQENRIRHRQPRFWIVHACFADSSGFHSLATLAHIPYSGTHPDFACNADDCTTCSEGTGSGELTDSDQGAVQGVVVAA